MKFRARRVQPPPEKPIFVFGCPRSGTSLVYELLDRHPRVKSLGTEGHTLWNAYQHPRTRKWSSDRVDATNIRSGEARFLYSAIAGAAQKSRFLDKTPKNVLRVPYLAKLFPDAKLVFVNRDGRATVASLIEGWTKRRGLSYRMPEPLRLDEYHGRLWSYILPPGWRRVAASSFAEVAALQYVTSNDIYLSDREELGERSTIEVAYEDLVVQPEETARALLRSLELEEAPEVMTMAARLDEHQAGAITPPRPDKWLDRRDEIERVLPTIAPTMARLGYPTGDRP